MALSRRTGTRFQASIWPGFVDAMTSLLLVLMFVLTIFMVVQYVLRETISGQASKLDALSVEVEALAQALGLEQEHSATLSSRIGELTATLGDARRLQQDQAARIASFEEQVASLMAQREDLVSERDSLEMAIAGQRAEIDAQTEAARLAAARREALEALVADLRRQSADAQAALGVQVTDLEAQLSAEEKARLAEAAAAEALRDRLAGAETELTAMTLALEEQRRNAEETLSLLAAAETATDDLEARLAAALTDRDQTETLLAEANDALAAQQISGEEVQDIRRQLAAALAAKLAAENAAAAGLDEAETRAALLAQAQAELSEQEELASEAQRQQALLNRQIAALREQLSGLQALLDDARTREAATDIQMQSLGRDLNTALARVAAEERRARELEQEKQKLQEERLKLLEAENQDLERYRSEFFGRLRDVLGGQEGVRIVGDRFVFSSEVLFAPGEASLSPEGEVEIAKVTDILGHVANDIPQEIDWVLQVDGHTDDVPLAGTARFADNWELSQARALSVVRYMIDVLGMPPDRLSANGFGQYQPVDTAGTPEARAHNRRIELKFTGK